MNDNFSKLIIGIIIGIIITVARAILRKPIEDIIMRFPWSYAKKSSLTGTWLSVYTYKSQSKPNYTRKVCVPYELKHLPFNFIIGRQLGLNSRPAILRCKKDSKGYISGSYENPDDGDELHGMLQLWIHSRGSALRGKFIGYSATMPSIVNEGDWHWIKIPSSDAFKKNAHITKQTIINEFTKHETFCKEINLDLTDIDNIETNHRPSS